MEAEQQGIVLGSVRLLILAVIAALGGCILFFFLSASPASAEESPHTDPGGLAGVTGAISQVDEQITSGAETIATGAAAKLTTTVTAVTTRLTTSATELASALHIPELAGTDRAGTHASTAAGLSAIANNPALRTASAASATAAEEAMVEPDVAPAAAPEPRVNHSPAAPDATAGLAGSSSGFGGGGSMFAVTNERDWTPRLSSGMSRNSDDPAPSSSNDGSDPAPD